MSSVSENDDYFVYSPEGNGVRVYVNEPIYIHLGRVRELSRALQVLKDEQDVLRSQERSVSRQVQDLYASIEASLRRQKDSLLEELTTHTGEISGTLANHIRHVLDCVLNISKSTCRVSYIWNPMLPPPLYFHQMFIVLYN